MAGSRLRVRGGGGFAFGFQLPAFGLPSFSFFHDGAIAMDLVFDISGLVVAGGIFCGAVGDDGGGGFCAAGRALGVDIFHGGVGRVGAWRIWGGGAGSG